MSGTPPTKRARRSSAQVRELLVGAARRAFTEHGLDVTTKEIAEAAGVAESAIYSQFGSKSELFRAAVFSTFDDALEGWVASWEGSAAEGDIVTMAGDYIRAVYRVARDNRTLLRLLMANSVPGQPSSAELAHESSRRLANGLGRVQRVVRLGAAARGYPLDDAATLASATAMVIAMATLDDWLIPDELASASEERLIREMTALCLYGITNRPGGD